ncbi:MAG: BON domain-containing protein [Acidobacteriota bacterium]|nr:BON domain-containing protein [Acidobacteriota bacterium]
MKRISGVFFALTATAVLSSSFVLAQGNSAARTDGQIEMDVVHALDGVPQLKNDLITAATVQGEVTLAGTVSNQSSIQLAESTVRGVPGVTGVHNNLKVGNPNDDPNAQDAADAPGDSDPGPAAQTAQNQPYTQVQAGQNNQNQSGPDQGQYNNQAPPPTQTAQNQAPDWGPAGPPPDYNENGQQQGQYSQQQGQYNQQGPDDQQPQNGQYSQVPAQQNGQNQTPDWGPAGPPPDYNQNGQQRGQYSQQQPAYGQQPYRPQYGAAGPRYNAARGPVTVPAGTVLQVRTAGPVDSKHATEGTPLTFTVISDVSSDGYLAIPRGATVHGVIAYVQEAGQLTGAPKMGLQLTSLDLGGRNYPLTSNLFRVRGPSKTGRTVGNTIGGALLGAIIGGAAGGGGGAAIGAVAGGGAGTALSAASRGPGAWIPAEALVSFRLTQPVTVYPVSEQEAARLAQGLYPGGPTLYRRGGGYGYPPRRRYYAPYYGYGYGPGYYGPVYYRPYFMAGGVYYWR